MRLPRLTIRELVLLVAVVALSIAWGMELLIVFRLRSEVLAVNAIADQEQAEAAAEIAELRAKLAECLDRFGEAE